MKKPLVAIAVCAIARLAFAQDAGRETAVAEAPTPADGPHDIAVFTGVPNRPPLPEWTAAPRVDGRYSGHPGGQAPLGGIEGFTLGRQYDLEYLALADVGDDIHGGPARQTGSVGMANGMRTNGGVRYYNSRAGLGNAGGLSTGASWTVPGLGGNPQADRAWGMTVGFDYGALSLRAAHQNRHVAQVQLYNLTGANMDAKNSLIAANLRTRWGTAYAAYAANRGWGSSPLYNPDNPYGAGVASTSSTDSRDTLFGVAVPWSQSFTLLASFIHKNDRDLADRDANQIAVGASYVLSRKTDFYTALSHTLTTGGTGVLIGGAAHPSGSSAINVGMRHAF
jgi:predicted porin